MRSASARSLAAALQRGAMVIGGVRRRPRRRRDFCAPLGLGPLHRTLGVPFGPLWRRVLARLARPHSSGRLAEFGQHSGRPLSARSPLPALWPLPAWVLSRRHGPALPWHRRRPRRCWLLRRRVCVCSSCPSAASESFPVAAPTTTLTLPLTSRSKPYGLGRLRADRRGTRNGPATADRALWHVLATCAFFISCG